MLRCNLSCRHVSVSHYHCKHCQETILRKCDFQKHVANHSRSRSPIRVKRPVAREVHKVQCTICGEELLSSNIKRHKLIKHQIEQSGMIINLFTQIMYIIHTHTHIDLHSPALNIYPYTNCSGQMCVRGSKKWNLFGKKNKFWNRHPNSCHEEDWYLS